MGLAFDKMLNKPPFGSDCNPKCTSNIRGSICYKGKCHYDCPEGSSKVQGKCKCKNGTYRNPNKKIKDSWGNCVMAKSKQPPPPKRLSEKDLEDKGFVFPEGYNESYKQRVIMAVSYNPTMSKDDFEKQVKQVKESSEQAIKDNCPEEAKILETIKTNNNNTWPEKPINIPWESTKPWPSYNELSDCEQINKLYDTIKNSNKVKYGNIYDTVLEQCNDNCKKKMKRSVIKDIDQKFPSSINDENNEKIVDCTSECNRNCSYTIDTNNIGDCDKNCNDGSGPGKKTAKITIYKKSLGTGTCPVQNGEEGKTYDIELECNKHDCPTCEVFMKKPYYDDTEDYRGFTKYGTIYQKCLKDGEEIDCGGAEGDHNYKQGARTKYTVEYNELSNNKGKLCIPGPPVITEPCKPFAEDPVGNKIKKSDIGQTIYQGELERDPDTEFVMGGGKKCNENCIYSGDYPKIVDVCNATCDGGTEKRQKLVIADKSAPSCPEPEKKDFVCADTPCNAPCVLQGNGEYYQINEACPGVYGGPYENVTWDSQNNKWSDNKEHKRNLKQAVLVPALGTGTCDLKEKEEPCPTDNIVQPIDCKFGPWKFDRIEGENITVNKVTYPHLSHPRYGQDCVNMNSLGVIGIYPKKVFKREIEQKAMYGGKACVGPMEKKEDYLKENGSYEKNACPQDQQFVPPLWKNINWNIENCKSSYTEKEVVDASKRNFEINEKWPSMDNISSSGNKIYFETKTRTKSQGPGLIAKYGGFESNEWYELAGKETPEEKYPPLTDYRLKKYRLCKNLSEINYPNPGWKLHKNVVTKDCNPVYRKENKIFKSKKFIFSNNTNDLVMKPKIEDNYFFNNATNSPKFPHGYLTTGYFVTSKHDGEPNTFNPVLDGTGFWNCPGKDHWLQIETLSNNIETIKGIVYTGKGSDKGFRVQYSRNKSSWSDDISLKNVTGNLGDDKKLKVFNEPVEARYLRIYPEGSMEMQVGYLQQNDGVTDCKGGYSGRKTVWSKLVFDKELTKQHGQLHEGNTENKCPPHGTRLAVCLGNDEDCKNELRPNNFVGKKYSDNGTSVKVLSSTNFSVPKDCGTDCLYGSWYSSTSEAAQNTWGPCVKEDGTNAKTPADNGYQYQYKFVREESSNLSSNTKPGLSCFPQFMEKVADDFEQLEAERSHRVRRICNRT